MSNPVKTDTKKLPVVLKIEKKGKFKPIYIENEPFYELPIFLIKKCINYKFLSRRSTLYIISLVFIGIILIITILPNVFDRIIIGLLLIFDLILFVSYYELNIQKNYLKSIFRTKKILGLNWTNNYLAFIGEVIFLKEDTTTYQVSKNLSVAQSSAHEMIEKLIQKGIINKTQKSKKSFAFNEFNFIFEENNLSNHKKHHLNNYLNFLFKIMCFSEFEKNQD